MNSISMKLTLRYAIVLLAVVITACNQQAKQGELTPSPSNISELFPKGDTIERAHFTNGQAWVHWILRSDSIYNTQLAHVTYGKGTRTRWHYHPAGQIIIITSGTAFYQEEGKPKRVLNKGDMATCPPDTPHWHGGSAESGMTMMAINPNMNKGGVQWLDRVVTDEEYSN
jgi:quercetin dioxygenase-like cupin family protein